MVDVFYDEYFIFYGWICIEYYVINKRCLLKLFKLFFLNFLEWYMDINIEIDVFLIRLENKLEKKNIW